MRQMAGKCKATRSRGATAFCTEGEPAPACVANRRNAAVPTRLAALKLARSRCTIDYENAVGSGLDNLRFEWTMDMSLRNAWIIASEGRTESQCQGDLTPTTRIHR